MKVKPLAFVLTNAALNDLFDFWVIDFIKAGWFYTLNKRKGKIIAFRIFFSFGNYNRYRIPLRTLLPQHNCNRWFLVNTVYTW